MFGTGQQIGSYTLIRKLGRGGFGEVWLAERRSQFLAKKVAIKLPHEEQVDFEAIRREAEIWEKASGHPNVLPIIDADIYDGQVIIVSEYADGGSLADKLKTEGKFSPKQAVEMTVGILNGLEFLHNKKIIHRDIKPQNVLLQGETPRLADFGISRAMNTSTFSSVVVGTDAYMSPEAFDGKRNVQTDIWSVGIVLYQLLKGALPFPQEHQSERIFAILTKDFAPLPENISSDLKSVLEKALAKNPTSRYQSAAAMRTDLQNAVVRLSQSSTVETWVLPKPSASTLPVNDETTKTALQNLKSENPIPLPTQPAAGKNISTPTFYKPATFPNIARSVKTYPPQRIDDAFSKTALGLNANVGAMICYLGNLICALGLIYSVIVLLTDKTTRLTRFHAIQSILLAIVYFASAIAASILPVLLTQGRNSDSAAFGSLIYLLVIIANLIVMIYSGVQGYRGKMSKLPVIGNLADKWA